MLEPVPEPDDGMPAFGGTTIFCGGPGASPALLGVEGIEVGRLGS